MSKLDLIVAGAGIGGLTAAIALQRDGHRVRVFEQAPSLGEIGAGVMGTPNATRVLYGLGLKAELDAIGVKPEFATVRDSATAEVLSRTPLGDGATQRNGAPFYYLHRADLHTMLVNAVLAHDPNAITLNHALVEVDQDGASATAIFANGERASGDAVIGADGIKSRARHAVAPDAETVFTGNVAWRGLVPADKLDPSRRHVEGEIWAGPGRHLVCYGLRGGTLKNYVAIAEQDAWQDEGWTVRAEVGDVLKEFADWHPDIRDMLAATPPDNLFKWGLFDRAPADRMSAGRIAVLGDAAHPMLPFLGQGACMAIEDAAVLAHALRRYDDVEEALKVYSDLRLGRTAWVQTQARKNQKLFHDGSSNDDFDADRDIRISMLYGYDAFNVVT